MVFSIGFQKLQFDELGNPYFLRIVDAQGKTEKILPEQTNPPCLKNLTVFVAIVRSGYTPDMRVKKWIGLQEVKISIPDERELKYYYLCYDKRAMSNICVKILSNSWVDGFGNYNSITWNLNLKPSKESIEFGWVKPVGEAKEVTPQKLASMLQNREIIAVMNDDGEQLVS
jgi:hypothetical protein